MKKINEIIVVEGTSDKNHLLSFLEADILTCNGSAIDGFDLEYLKTLALKRGIIILTDPDYPGEKIRQYLNANISNCKNAFINKKYAIKKKKVGVAECLPEEILRALENMVTFKQNEMGTLTTSDMYLLKLIGNENSNSYRRKVSERFNLGKCNGKTLLNRLNLLNITFSQIQEVLNDK